MFIELTVAEPSIKRRLINGANWHDRSGRSLFFAYFLSLNWVAPLR
ncbi:MULTISPECIES: hypothetical protein [Bosea]|jgi:hypothetical protein|nr:hypothetical protein [Bosea vaviloviae]